jgi:hypothetical protein
MGIVDARLSRTFASAALSTTSPIASSSDAQVKFTCDRVRRQSIFATLRSRHNESWKPCAKYQKGTRSAFWHGG